MKYSEALSYLSSFDNLERRRNAVVFLRSHRIRRLDRMRRLLARLGHPECEGKFVHITGTNGKGSTAAFLASLARTHGYRTGLYTSPHLVDIRERIQINGELIPKEKFARHMGILRAAVEESSWPRDLGVPTYFELLTALAFSYFRDERVDLAVLEVGMGGRWDATNVILPLVSVITPIGLDHQHVLGRTVREIAKEKAEIIKRWAPVCSGPQERAALDVIKAKCRLEHAPLIEQTYVRVRRLDESGSVFDVRANGQTIHLTSTLSGVFQPQNAGLAITAYQTLAHYHGLRFSNRLVIEGIRRAFWPGRFEIVSKKPYILLDGAHNLEGVRSLVASLAKVFSNRRFHIVFGASQDKDIKAMLRQLRRLKPILYPVRARHARAASLGGLVHEARGLFRHVYPADSLTEGLKEAARHAGERDIVVVAGSLYLVGEVRRMLCPR